MKLCVVSMVSIVWWCACPASLDQDSIEKQELQINKKKINEQNLTEKKGFVFLVTFYPNSINNQ